MLPYRQVHLDFHTSECIKGIGKRFSKENFKEALIKGRVNSITLFSKCHHGYAYHPTKANVMHPGLDFDLLGAQLEVCKELGVRTEIYISAGFDEKYAREHKEHIICNADGGYWPFDKAGYHRLCFNTSYLDTLCEQIKEVTERYKGLYDGIFLDIIAATPCYCEKCKKDMQSEGVDINDFAAVLGFARRVYQKYCDRVDEAMQLHANGIAVIHNDGGAIFQGRNVAFRNTGHLELESLPTGGWGYDHFPRAAAYARTLGKEFLGMTGKFHTTWGEFGGYKHPNALRYEAALSNICGAKCSVGDQLHPDGEMDMATYSLIGQAYTEVEKREKWLIGQKNIADIAVLSAEAAQNGALSSDFDLSFALKDGIKAEIGINRILLEGHYLYDIVDPESELDGYKLLILTDGVKVRGGYKAKIEEFIARGGKLLSFGNAGIADSDETFIKGLRIGDDSPYRPNYLTPVSPLGPNGKTSYVMYGRSYEMTLDGSSDAKTVYFKTDPYFNRTAEHFCSHQHTPYDRETGKVGAVMTDSMAHISWDICTEYARYGSLHLRYAVTQLIDALLKDEKTLCTTLPSLGVASVSVGAEHTAVMLAYAPTKPRGEGIEVIEDLPALVDTSVTLKLDKAPSRVFLPLTDEELPFTYEKGKLTFTVPRFECSTLAIIK